MHGWLALLFFFAQPFWEVKPPEKWTSGEIELMRTSSPWTQTLGPAPEVLMWFATALPVEQAESEARLRTHNPLGQPDPDYTDFLVENREKVFVLAVAYPTLRGLSSEADAWKRLEKETSMRVAARSYPVAGVFPPAPSDPVLRIVFPRMVQPTDKSIELQLYLPGLPFPEREADFRVKDLIYHGKLAM
jgi:hypothetical protein